MAPGSDELFHTFSDGYGVWIAVGSDGVQVNNSACIAAATQVMDAGDVLMVVVVNYQSSTK